MSAEVKPGYKQTDVGVIPEDWSVKRLGEIGESLIGLTYKPSNVRADGLLVLRSSNISDGALRFEDNVFVHVEVPERIIVRNGDILICVRNGSRELIGKCAQIDEPAAGVTFGAFMTVFRTPFHRFVYHQFQSALIKRQIHEHLGATINQITNKSLNSFRIPFPEDDAEQRAIAGALSDVDALIGALEKLIAKKRDLKQAAMQQLLTGQKRLPGFHGEWEILIMAEKSTLKARIGWQGLTTAEYLPTGEYYLVTGTDFVGGRVNWATCCFVDASRYVQDKNIQLKPRDILLTKDGTIGKVGFVDALPGPATLNSGVFVIRPKGDAYDPLFFYYILTSRVFEDFLAQLQAGSTISHLYQKDFVNFRFRAPSVPEQTAIADVLSDMDAEIAALEQRLAKTRALKQGMMQELLTGRIRLV